MPLVYAHEILSQCDIYFLNGSHLSKFILALLSTRLNLEPSYLAQLCTYTGATPQGRNYTSINNILKVMNFKKKSHFALFDSLQTCQRY